MADAAKPVLNVADGPPMQRAPGDKRISREPMSREPMSREPMADHWFKPRSYGWGAAPANWKGWAAVAGYLAAVLALILPLTALPADMPAAPAAWQVATAALMLALTTWAFLRLCRAKTDGEWAWRWGKQR